MNKNRISSWENHLLQRAASGDSVAFELLVDELRPTLHSLAIRVLRNTDDANDAVQETFLKAIRSANEFDSSRPVKPWLCRICANCCVDTIRRRKRAGESLENHEYRLMDPTSLEAVVEDSLDRAELMRAIAKLPKNYRRIIVMRHFGDMEVNDIAQALHAPEGTVKSWLFRARAQLRKELAAA